MNKTNTTLGRPVPSAATSVAPTQTAAASTATPPARTKGPTMQSGHIGDASQAAGASLTPRDAQWARLRFAGGRVHDAAADASTVARAVEASMPNAIADAVNVELKKREPWLRGLADLLGVELDVLKQAAARSTHINITRAQVVPAQLADPTLGYERERSFGSLQTVHNTSIGVAGRRMVLSVGSKQLYVDGPLSRPNTTAINAPIMQLEPGLYDDVARHEPGVLRGIEKLASYASHDVLHMLFDNHWDTRAGNEKEWLLGLETEFKKGFTPNVYEYALCGLMRAAFARACEMYPQLEGVVLRDAEALVVSVEAYRAKALATPTEMPASDWAAEVDKRCQHLLGVGLSKSLAFLVNPGPPPGTPEAEGWKPATEGEKQLRGIFARYPTLWTNTVFQRDIHAPKIEWRKGGDKKGRVDIATVGRMLLGLSLHRDLEPDLTLAERLAPLTHDNRLPYLKAQADAGNAEAMFALANAKDAPAPPGNATWMEMARDAGLPSACSRAAAEHKGKDAALRFALLQRTTRITDLYDLALCYLDGIGTERDISKATSTLKRALAFENTNFPDAELALWRCYSEGTGANANPELAEKHLQRAAELGSAQAKSVLKARELRAAAETGGTEAKLALADVLKGPERIALLEGLAAEGSGPAMLKLGRVYYIDEDDNAKAAHWYGRAAAHGEEGAESRQHTALIACGDEASLALAAELKQRAAAAGKEWAISATPLRYDELDWSQPLAAIYKESSRLQGDEAVKAYQRLDELGHAEASASLALYYRYGMAGVEKDTAMATTYYERGAGDGKPGSAYEALAAVESRDGPARPGTPAMKWLEEAAARGHETAQIRLRQLAWSEAAQNARPRGRR